MLVTNQAWLMELSRDCPGPKYHKHAEIGFDKEVKTRDLARYAPGLLTKWVRLFRRVSRRPAQEELPVLRRRAREEDLGRTGSIATSSSWHEDCPRGAASGHEQRAAFPG